MSESARAVSGKEANTTDACGFPPGPPPTLSRVYVWVKVRSKCLAQNKQATRAEGVSAMTAFQSGHATNTPPANYKTACWTEQSFFKDMSSSNREKASVYSLNCSNKSVLDVANRKA